MNSWSKSILKWSKRPAEKMDAALLALVADTKAAARLREYRNDNNVAALTIERSRDRLDRWGWLFLFAGLAYTTVNVQAFVAGSAEPWGLRWLTAWLVEPMVMGLMLVLLRGEQIANRYGEKAGRWVICTRWSALGITYVMNTATYYGRGDVGEIFIHSVPVVLVFLAAESLVQQRLTLTSVVDGLSTFRRTGLGLNREAAPSRKPEPDPQTAQEAPDPPVAAESTPDDLQGPRTLKEQAYRAFCELVEQGRSADDLGPAEVDRQAGVRVGTSKVPGRMAEFRDRWVREQNSGVRDDATSA